MEEPNDTNIRGGLHFHFSSTIITLSLQSNTQRHHLHPFIVSSPSHNRDFFVGSQTTHYFAPSMKHKQNYLCIHNLNPLHHRFGSPHTTNRDYPKETVEEAIPLNPVVG